MNTIVRKELVAEECMLCGNDEHVVLTSRIREGNFIVLQCGKCDVVFLQDYKELDYSSGYATLIFNKEWDTQDAILKRSESLKRFNQIIADIIKDQKLRIGNRECSVLEIGPGTLDFGVSHDHLTAKTLNFLKDLFIARSDKQIRRVFTQGTTFINVLDH